MPFLHWHSAAHVIIIIICLAVLLALSTLAPLPSGNAQDRPPRTTVTLAQRDPPTTFSVDTVPVGATDYAVVLEQPPLVVFWRQQTAQGGMAMVTAALSYTTALAQTRSMIAAAVTAYGGRVVGYTLAVQNTVLVTGSRDLADHLRTLPGVNSVRALPPLSNDPPASIGNGRASTMAVD